MKMTRLFSRWSIKLINRIWLVFATLVILIAVVISLLRALLPFTYLLESDIESFLSEKLGAQVTFDAISAGWEDQGPLLELKNIQVYDTEQQLEILKVGQSAIQINFWQSIFSWKLITTQFKLLDSHVQLDLNTLSLSSAEQNNEEVTSYDSYDFILDLVLGQNDVDIQNLKLSLIDQSEQHAGVTLDQLQINNFDDIHQLEGKITQGETGQLDLIIEQYGDPRFIDGRTAVFVNSRAIDMVQLPLLETVLGGRLSSGFLNGTIYAEWDEGSWQSAQADAVLEPVVFTIKNREFVYKKISTQLVWQKTSSFTSEAILNNFNAIDENQKQIELGGLKLFLNQQPLPKAVISYQDVEPGQLNSLWALMMPEEELQSWFLKADPQLKIKDLQLTFERPQEQWGVTSGFVDVAQMVFNRTESTPALPPLNGTIEFDGENFSYNLRASRGEFDYRPLFRYPIPIEDIALSGQYINFEEGGYLTFDNLDLNLTDAIVGASGNIYFHQEKSPELSIYAELYNANTAKTPLFLPVAVMEQNLVDYLDQSVKSGRIDYARFNFQGALVASMLSQPDVTFDIWAKAKRLEYKFQPDWPTLENLDATLFFNQDSMFISSDLAGYNNLKVSKAIAKIDDFGADDPILDLDIATTTDHLSARSFVDNSRLKLILGDLLDSIQPQKKYQVDTKVALSLGDGDRLEVDGKVKLDNSPIDLVPLDLKVDSVTGVIQFDETKVWSEPLSINALGGLSSLTLNTETVNESDRITLNLGGEVNIQNVSKWIFKGSQFPVADTSKVMADGWICISSCGAKNIHLNIKSNLQGATIDFPAPFTKSADLSWPVEIAVDQTQTGQTILFDINSGIKGHLSYVSKKGELVLNGMKFDIDSFDPQLPAKQQGIAAKNLDITDGINHISDGIKSDHISISSNIEQLELFEWISSIVGSLAKTEDNSEPSPGFKLLGRVNLDTLNLASIPLTQVVADIKENQQQEYEIHLVSKEAKGVVRILPDLSVAVELEKLHLPKSILDRVAAEGGEISESIESSESVESPEESPITHFNGWPEMSFSCLDCSIFDINLGTLWARIIPNSHHLKITGTAKRDTILNSSFTIDWAANEKGANTDVNALISSKKMGNLLRLWGAKIGIRESAGDVAVNLNWQGAPHDFAFDKLNGGASVNLSDGYLEEVSDAKARIISLFSLQSIARRLSLDFKDIYKDGFFYSSISGDFTLRRGIVSTEGFYLNGNAADVLVSGQVNLNNETLDQYASITPKVTSSLPVLAGWAIEPTTGVLVWLLSKIFEPAIDVITNIKYRLVGSWDKPEVIEFDKSIREIELTSEQMQAIQKAYADDDTEPQAEPNETDPQDTSSEQVDPVNNRFEKREPKENPDNKPPDSIDDSF